MRIEPILTVRCIITMTPKHGPGGRHGPRDDHPPGGPGGAGGAGGAGGQIELMS